MHASNSPSTLQLDKQAVRALAHPLRSRLLTELRVNGPATATELAERLGTNTGATSYHLRELERVALVSDSGKGVGKRRIWQARGASHSWQNSAFTDDPDARASLDWLRREYLRTYAARAEQWLAAEASWPEAWVDQLGFDDAILTVSPSKLGEFRKELRTLTEKYREPEAESEHEAARRILFVTHAVPLDTTPPPSQ